MVAGLSHRLLQIAHQIANQISYASAKRNAAAVARAHMEVRGAKRAAAAQRLWSGSWPGWRVVTMTQTRRSRLSAARGGHG